MSIFSSKMTTKQEFYAEQLKEKDKIIENLKAENRMLLDTSLKKSEEIEDLKMHLKKCIDAKLNKKKKV